MTAARHRASSASGPAAWRASRPATARVAPARRDRRAHLHRRLRGVLDAVVQGSEHQGHQRNAPGPRAPNSVRPSTTSTCASSWASRRAKRNRDAAPLPGPATAGPASSGGSRAHCRSSAATASWSAVRAAIELGEVLVALRAVQRFDEGDILRIATTRPTTHETARLELAGPGIARAAPHAHRTAPTGLRGCRGHARRNRDPARAALGRVRRDRAPRRTRGAVRPGGEHCSTCLGSPTAKNPVPAAASPVAAPNPAAVRPAAPAAAVRPVPARAER